MAGRTPVRASECYPAFAGMGRAVSKYFRTSKLRVDMYAYLDRLRGTKKFPSLTG